MAFKSGNPGCNNCCGGCQSPTVFVSGCGGVGVSGAAVSFVLGGVAYGPWTTDGTGHAVISIPAAGTPNWTITPPGGSGYATLASSRVVNCSLLAYTFALSVSPGYQCGGPTCCVGGTSAAGPPYLSSAVAWPATLYLNDGFGTVTMSGVGGPTFHYTGCAPRTAANAYDHTACGIVGSTSPNVSVPVYFTLNCSGTAVTLSVDFGVYSHSVCGGTCFPAGVCAVGNPNLAEIHVSPSSPTCPGPPPCGFMQAPAASHSTASGPSCPPGSIALSFSVGPYVSGVACNVIGGGVETGLQNVPFQVYGAGPASVSVTS